MLTILGAGGWLPAYGRQTASAVLRNGDEAVMIDAGTGVARLVEQPDVLAGVRRLHILLTHFHLDHIAGLAYLPALGICEDTTLWGPGHLLYDTATEVVLSAVSHEPMHPVPLERQDISVRDIPAAELELAGMRITTRRQDRHSAPTLGLRFDDELTWITDTAFDPDSAAFAHRSRLVAHEAWFTRDLVRNADIHCSAQGAAEVATRAECERLLLIHLPPFQESVQALVAEAQTELADVTPARDGAVVSER
jgi:ribonuclease BN (tRNA processing enzyme)